MVYKTNEAGISRWCKIGYTKQNRLKKKYVSWYYRKSEGIDRCTLVIVAKTKLPEDINKLK